MRRYDIRFYDDDEILTDCDDSELREILHEYFYGWKTRGELEDIYDEINELKVDEEYEYSELKFKDASCEIEQRDYLKVKRVK